MKTILILITAFLLTSSNVKEDSHVEIDRTPYYMVRIEQKAKQGELNINQIKNFLNDRER